MAGFDHFTHLAPYYDRAIPFTTLEQLLDLGKFSESDIVLDAGGGTGRVASALVPYVKKVVVADLSQGMLVQADRKGLDAVHSPVESLPFEDNAFDRIVMVDALHHVCNQQESADEMWRVLAPGGMIVVQEPDVRRFLVKLVALAEKIALMRSHFLPPDKIAGLFKERLCEIKRLDEDFSTWILVKKPD
jgi:demethylmenaquinone methyltransferase/2-methoxy-6-polyprenyl-1,4-benzoquinol methylase